MIPKYTECMLPILQQLRDGKVYSLKDLVECMSKVFNLSHTEKLKLLPSGKTTVIHYRTGWAKWHLEQKGLLKTVSRGKYIITNEGINFLKLNKNITL